jgi:flagellar protein FliS
VSSPFQAYKDNAILSASPARLLTMLYDRLLLDLNCAKDALELEDAATATYRIKHAGEIVAALAGSLRRDRWDGADGLLGLYLYVSNALVRASIYRDVQLVDECTILLEPLRQAWHEAAESLASIPEWETDTSSETAEVVAIA